MTSIVLTLFPLVFRLVSVALPSIPFKVQITSVNYLIIVNSLPPPHSKLFLVQLCIAYAQIHSGFKLVRVSTSALDKKKKSPLKYIH